MGGLVETGSTLVSTPDGWKSEGAIELTYSCSGCEDENGDPYSRMGSVVIDRKTEEVIENSMDGWELCRDVDGGPTTRAYCPKCVSKGLGTS